MCCMFFFFFSSRRRHTRCYRDWSSDVCSSDLGLLFGNIDTWIIWNLTGQHMTDVTNASRTMLMNLNTLDWDDEVLNVLGIPRAMLPEIKSSSDVYGHVT